MENVQTNDIRQPADNNQTAKNNSPSIQDLKNTYQRLVFVHEVLFQRSQFTVQEFDIAKDATVMITEMCNKLGAEIKSLESAVAAPNE